MKKNESGFSRRDFIKKTSYGVAGAFAYQFSSFNSGNAFAEEIISPRKGLGNLYLKEGKPLLVVSEGKDRAERFKKALDKIGGLEKLVKGKTVILKPNAVAPTPFPVCTESGFPYFCFKNRY